MVQTRAQAAAAAALEAEMDVLSTIAEAGSVAGNENSSSDGVASGAPAAIQKKRKYEADDVEQGRPTK